VLGFQEGVSASHTSLLINTNLYIRIVIKHSAISAKIQHSSSLGLCKACNETKNV